MNWEPIQHKALTYERLKEFLQNTGYTGVSPETEIKTLLLTILTMFTQMMNKESI